MGAASVPLSHLSITAKYAPQQIPDFTRGEWEKARSGMDSEDPEESCPIRTQG
ncbi:hypothetical protein [Streptomyces sp. NPDC014734]|uniref:hypothetical protein n=1 Tax=Streptomyces sp. NPDC014734 TaxID=3364886 RepID=UPI0036FF3E2E